MLIIHDQTYFLSQSQLSVSLSCTHVAPTCWKKNRFTGLFCGRLLCRFTEQRCGCGTAEKREVSPIKNYNFCDSAAELREAYSRVELMESRLNFCCSAAHLGETFSRVELTESR